MAMNDLLSDMLARLRNGQKAHLASVEAMDNKLCRGVLDVLKAEGYIVDFEVVTEGNKSKLVIKPKYHEGTGVISKIRRVSTPGRRHYGSIKKLPKVNNGLGIYILSTSSGIMSDHEARQKNVGGEVLCSVF
jgi:small subunit ribosomal protein S8